MSASALDELQHDVLLGNPLGHALGPEDIVLVAEADALAERSLEDAAADVALGFRGEIGELPDEEVSGNGHRHLLATLAV